MGTLGWLQRWWRVRRSALDRDPEAALDEVLANLDEQVAEARGQLAVFQGESERVQGRLREAQCLAEHEYAHAAHALLLGEEALAREAMRQHLHAAQQLVRYQRQAQHGAENIERLRQLLALLESHRADTEAQRQQLAMRNYLARARYALARTLYGEHGRMLITRAEEALSTEEFTADAYVALTAQPDDDPPALDTALADLRGQLGLPPP